MGAFPTELQPAKNDLVVTKHYPSAFFGTSLAATLRTADVVGEAEAIALMRGSSRSG